MQGEGRESREKEDLGKFILVVLCTFVIVCICFFLYLCKETEGIARKIVFVLYVFLYLYLFVQGERRNREKEDLGKF